MNKAIFCGLLSAALVAGLALRFGRLDIRPMHHDEANQAVKFGTLLETGEYRYDRNDHHGPTLYYLTLPAAWIRGQATMAELDEWTLRAVPAVMGIGLILLFGLLAGGLGREAVAAAACFAALSPALTYYSRFYIQESLFVFLVLGLLLALGRYVLRPHTGWAAAAGICAGLAYATKETSIIVFASAGAALVLSLIAAKRIPFRGYAREDTAGAARPVTGRRYRGAADVVIGLAVALFVAGVFYSSFFRNPGGILESVRAFREYAARGTEAGFHAHPWSFYLEILGFRAAGGLIWSEGMILLLALAGAVCAVSGKWLDNGDAGQEAPVQRTYTPANFWARYLFLYSLFTAVAFSSLRYKTPWNLLPFYVGFVLLAGAGTAALLRSLRSGWARGLLLLALTAGLAHLGIQNWRANYLYPADPRNPYVYAQTSPDFLRLGKRVHDLAAIHPDGKSMLVKVIASPYEQWPLPWYLRDLRRVGYWTEPAEAGGFAGVPVVIAAQENAGKLEAALGDRFQAEFYGLRPGVLLTIYIDRALWDRYLGTR
jgi:uncharacterized protein (TIGR03663 family)